MPFSQSLVGEIGGTFLLPCETGCPQLEEGIVQSPPWKEVVGGSDTSSRWKVLVVTSQIPLSDFVIGCAKESKRRAERKNTLMANRSQSREAVASLCLECWPARSLRQLWGNVEEKSRSDSF